MVHHYPILAGCLTLMAVSAPAQGTPPGASGAAQTSPRRRPPPRMSGAKDKPVPGESRFPAEQARPTGALLAALPAGRATLEKQSLTITCQGEGGGCKVRQRYELRSTGEATVLELTLLSPTAVVVKVDGMAHTAQSVDPVPGQRWESSGFGLDPASRKRYRLPGPKRQRQLKRFVLLIPTAPGRRHRLLVATNSVGGFDRFRRRRTEPEVAFGSQRRKDFFVHHHELRRRPPPGGSPQARRPALDVIIDVPSALVLGANIGLTCHNKAGRRRCHGRLDPKQGWLRWALAEPYKFPLAVFLSVGAGFTPQGVEAWLRLGVGLLLRKHKDVLAFSVETDAANRATLALAYQLYTPYSPSNWELGVHGTFGVAVDVYPKARPAIRLGAVLHLSVLRVELLADIYPTEFAKGGGPPVRFLLGVGLGF